MKRFIEGLIGHPLHPLLVHFPIGLFIFTVILDLASYIADEDGNAFVRGAFYTLLGGVALALVAALFGLVDFLDIRRDHPARKLALMHMGLNLTAVVLFAASLAWRWPNRDDGQTPIIAFLLALVANGAVANGGIIGGLMVFDNGIGVGRHRRRTDTPEATASASGRWAPDGFAPAWGAERLVDGETLRINVDGTVAVVGKTGGRYVAFQEFCTHRYGPLSEGRFCDGQIECPWHRSCFDVRTGEVTQGPAKEPIRIFPVEVRDGRVYVRVRDPEPVGAGTRPDRATSAGSAPRRSIGAT